MEKKIQEYLKYYLGQQALVTSVEDELVEPNRIFVGNTITINGANIDGIADQCFEVKPILRRLESMTEEEMNKGGWGSPTHFRTYMEYNRGAFHPEDFHYLLSLGFDLFNLIDQHSAIEKGKG